MKNLLGDKQQNGAEPPAHFYLVMVPVGIVLNLGVGSVVNLLKLPLFVDAVGTVVVTLLLGTRAGIIAGVCSFLLGGLLVNPVMPYFVATQAAIAIYVGVMAKHGWFATVPKRVLSGIGLGIVAAVISAPVIAIVFGGFTGSGSGAVTAFLLATGQSILKSVLLTGISCEPIDKTVQCLLACWLIQGLPNSAKDKFSHCGHLKSNNLL